MGDECVITYNLDGHDKINSLLYITEMLDITLYKQWNIQSCVIGP